VPVLPIIDLLILLGWSALMAGGALKAIHMTTTYRPSIFGLAPSDCLLIAGVLLTFAMTLAARTWVKLNEPTLLARRRARGFDSSERESSERQSEAEPSAAQRRRRFDER
jgi:hypothetical protein